MTKKIDPEKLEELKESVKIDNSKLEEILQIEPAEMTPKDQAEFLNLLKESNLILPVEITMGGFDLENAQVGDVITTKEETGFRIRPFADENQNFIVPLFTSDKIMEELGFKSNCMVMNTSDIADMIENSSINYHAIVINPNTEYSMGMDIAHFLNLFKEKEMNPMDDDEERKRFFEFLEKMLNILEKHSLELEHKATCFVRGPNSFMKEKAVDGAFVPDLPLNASTEGDFQMHYPYLNILLFDEGKKLVYFPDMDKKEHFNILIAPWTEFELVEELDEYTAVWKCGKQPFYDK